MSEATITCPQCRCEIKLNESLAAPLLEATRREFDKRLADQQAEMKRREEAREAQVAEKLKAARSAIAAEEQQRARLLLQDDIERQTREIEGLRERDAMREAKLVEAQQAQAEMLRKDRELADAKRELDLTIEKRVQASLEQTREAAKKQAEDEIKLTVAERDHTISGLKKQIDELKRKAEQGSQQLQGEVQELDLEAMLRSRFPQDTIEPVPKGEHGGDAVQRIIGPAGQPCGAILWESKRTKNWSDGWLTKLREDQRAARAEGAILVTQALPAGISTFDFRDGIWITAPATALPLAVAIRQALVELRSARLAGEGQETKTELVYRYLTGPRFRHRVEAIVEKFSEMRDDLDRERKSMTRLWAKREEQLRIVLESTAGMYGDLQGIAGKGLQEIEGLSQRMLPESSNPD